MRITIKKDICSAKKSSGGALKPADGAIESKFIREWHINFHLNCVCKATPPSKPRRGYVTITKRIFATFSYSEGRRIYRSHRHLYRFIHEPFPALRSKQGIYTEISFGCMRCYRSNLALIIHESSIATQNLLYEKAWLENGKSSSTSRADGFKFHQAKTDC